MPTDPETPGESDNPAADAMPRWEQVVEDMAATATAYRDRGWDAHEIHPGDVAITADDVERTGAELLAPDNEFDPLVDAFDSTAGFERAEVFRADTGGTVYAVVAFENEAAATAVLTPVYYSPEKHDEFVEMVEREGEVRIHVRPLDERRVLTFTIGDPDGFLPDGE
ncbi:hypothetical protein KTS45_09770 [Halomicroarcula limicola]|uniref:Uncharacterized protein n=1 Tax=Haloarcula limicola TaxID=1429915 RepID=A0A8J7YC12_9EURY|nr:hypothetical protein [Halomicroarcula limicola]MBV0924486.1 hypothetical protein [Halomicroarcula limicola]